MHTIRRIANGIRKVAAGLRPFNESVWPGVRNDLFVAHESIYTFALTYVSGKDVLDAGCGTGYGTAAMGRSAASAVGVDIDPLSIRYARRHFGADHVRFQTADLQALPFEKEFDAVVASNSLEHLEAPDKFIAGAIRGLRPGGVLIVAVPPIYSDHDALAHRHIHYHRANFTVQEWHALLVAHDFQVSCFVHAVGLHAARPDFSANQKSALTTHDFSFTAVAAKDIATKPSITAIFVASPTTSSKPSTP